ncbi:MAG: MipA/OmpV family protein [Methylococcales bacterium]|nr:MipA/OmpV family protein [Methylococcales bacterium]
MARKLIIIFLFSFSYCTILFATPNLSDNDDEAIQQAIEDYVERPWELGLAAGYGVRTNPLINSDDIPMYVVLNIAWFGDYFFFDNGDLGLAIHETEKLSISLIAHINNEREAFEWLNNSQLGIQFAHGIAETSPPSSSLSDIGSFDLEELNSIEVPKRSLAVDGGLELIIADDWGDFQLQVLTDISNTHNGVEVWASYAYPWKYQNLKIIPSIGINWKSSHLLDYYYGIRDSEADLFRPAYKASSGFNSFARLSISYHINDNWGITGVAEYEALSRSIRRSPIVDQEGITTLFIGLMYNF